MRRVAALLLALYLLSLSGCARSAAQSDDLRVLCATYPIYLFTTAVTQDVPGVEVSLLVNSQTSCLHDYTLTVRDMEAIDGADVIILNGAGLEDFMADALDTSDADVIDCSVGVDLLPLLEEHDHRGHDHDEEYDPHIWMDPHRAGQMAENIADGLSALGPGNADLYRKNLDAALSALASVDPFYLNTAFSPYQLITFHDGFQYFAQAYRLDLLKTIEEEEGATASANELRELIDLVEENHIPAIFVEKNGSRASADVIARETGCKVYELDMLMSGDSQGIQPYLDAIETNLRTILETYQ